MSKERNNLSFRVIETLAELSVSNTGWRKLLRRVSWNEGPVKYDIREWAPGDSNKMSRGITLSETEMDVIRDLFHQGRL